VGYEIFDSHPTKPPPQQYDALVDNHLLSIGQFSYHFSLRHSRRRDAAKYSDSVRNTVETCLQAGVELLQIASEVHVFY
jgi:hypothetical protein